MSRAGAASSGPASGLPFAVVLAVIVTALTAHDIAVERGGPGVTCDELYHVGYGKRLVSSLLRHGVRFFERDCIRETFGWSAEGPPVHPPLGNWLLGAFHWLFDPAPHELSRLAITPARLGSAVAFGTLVFSVTWAGIHWYGLAGGLAAGCSLVMMPRLFGHAHLAALDLITALMCTATVLAAARAHEHGKWWSFLLAGMVWGLALLTRFHGLLCAPPVVLWFLWQRRERALLPCLLWLGAGITVFILGWPWLWIDPLENLKLYLVSSTQRAPIHVYYMGKVWADVFVPRHYPWVMFLVTVPVGLLGLGFLAPGAPILARLLPGTGQAGPKAQLSVSHEYLFLGSIVFLLGVFTSPRVPVYDGVRLFLPVYPLWGLLVGRGTQWLWNRLAEHRGSKKVRPPLLLAVFFLLQAVGVLWFRPVWLSYYNLLVGGLAGAARLGFEVNYWGDALTEDILCQAGQQMKDGESLAFAPSLAPYQGIGILISSPCLAEKEISVAGWPGGSRQAPGGARWLIVYHRRADLQQIPQEILDRPAIYEISRQGVWLARLIRLESPSPAK